MFRATRHWVKKAEDDYRTARKLIGAKERFHDQVGFHCQQAAEKYLKAILNEHAQLIPKTHNCGQLLRLIQGIPRPIKLSFRILNYLTRFAVESRYLGMDTNVRQARAALRHAATVRKACRDELGLRTKPDE
jgi:HEPN domain-containing protein